MSVVIALAFVLGIVLPGSVYGRTSGSTHAKVYRFVLSNNFLGNDWRPQMERLATLTANLPPFKGQVTLTIQNAQNTTQAQIQSLNAVIATHPDAILLDAGSATALNPTVARACAAGIKVVSFDQPVTAPCAWKMTQNHSFGNILAGEWMGQILHGKGSVFVDRGLPGAPISKIIHDGFLKGLHMQAPAVKDVGEYDGGYAQGPEQQGISALLVGHPNVNGVMTQGYCKPVFNAFKNAGKPAVPATCYGYNGELVACARGHSCAIVTGSPVVVQLALELALKAVQGKPTPSKNQTLPVPWRLYVTNKAQFHPMTAGATIIQIKLGQNCYPNLPPGLALPFTLSRYHITPQQAAGR
jgi:ribose transport system substrate-binding protein